MKPLIVVQLLVYNESKDVIDRLMASLTAVQYPRDRWRLVIVNNVCTGHHLAEHLRARWMNHPNLAQMIIHRQDPNLGFAGGHQKALEFRGSPSPAYIYLLNADARVDPEFLTAIADTAESHPNAALIQSRIMLDQEPERLNSCGNAMHMLGFGFSLGYKERFLPQINGDAQKNLPMFYASGAGVLIRAKVLEEIGGLFDPSYFMYHEDVDLSWRARLMGYNVMLAPDSVIFHRYEFSKSIKKFYWMERNRHLTNLACYRWRTLVLLMPVYLVMELGTLVFSLKSGWGKEKMRSWAHFLKPSTWRWIGARRRLIQCSRKKSDHELMGFMTGMIVNQEVEQPILTHVVNPVCQIYLWLLRALVRW